MIAIVDKRMDKNIRAVLSAHGAEIVALEPWHLQVPVESHPDMLLFCGMGALICSREYYLTHTDPVRRITQASGLSLHLSDEKMGKEYPQDALFNALSLGNRLICNTRSVSRLILKQCKEHGARIVHVNQGYTRCSTLAVDDNAIITADPSIASACKNDGVNVLEISAGHISLPGYDYGFIGGASGVCGGVIYFIGNINLHPDGGRICEFIRGRGKEIVCLSDGELTDLGGIIFL